MGELTQETDITASYFNPQELFQLLDFTDKNGDLVITGKKEGYVSVADINQDGQIELSEAKYYLATLNFPRQQRELYELTGTDQMRISELFEDRIQQINANSEETTDNGELLTLSEYMLISGLEFIKPRALTLLSALPEDMSERAWAASSLRYFSNTYEESRDTFLNKISALQAEFPEISQTSIPVESEDFSNLTVDVAFIPATQTSKHCLVLISGTHGVEGFYGSAQQQYLLDQISSGRIDRSNVGIMLVHAYNPWGMRNELRFMEDGVDGNRNNLYQGTHAELENPTYAEVDATINPEGAFAENAEWRQGFRWKSIKQLHQYGKTEHPHNPISAINVGRTILRQAILQGQSEFPGGISFAGTSYADQLAPLTEFYKKHTEPYNEIVLMDVHTGLGEYGRVHYLSVDEDIPQEQRDRLSTMFGDVTFIDKESDEFYTVDGYLIGYLQNQSREDQNVLCIAPEAGTVGLGTLNQIDSLKTLIGMCQFGRDGAETPEDELFARQDTLGFLNPRHALWRELIIVQAANKLNNLFKVWANEDKESELKTGKVCVPDVLPYVQGYEIPATEYCDRIESVRLYLAEHELDAHVVSSEIALRYLTGVDFVPMERPFFMIIFRDQRQPRLLIPIMERTHFESQLKAIGLTDVESLTYNEYMAEPGHCWHDQMALLLKDTDRIAIEPSLPFDRALAIRDNYGEAPDSHVFMDNITEQLRTVKSDDEIALIRNASDYAVAGMEKLYVTTYPKMSIIHIFSLGKKVLQKILTDFHEHGVSPSGIHNSALIAAWPDNHSSDPHYIPQLTDRIERGAIHMAFVEFGGYYSELETKVECKKTSPEEKYYYDLMMKSREAALSLLGPGVTGAEVDEAAKQVFYDAELTYEQILHRTGHGLGMEHHEAPFLVAGDKTILEPGMVVSIEPGIYIKGRSEEVAPGVYQPIDGDKCEPEEDCPGAGGYRHSHTYLITETGYEDLTPFTTDWEDVTTYKGGAGAKMMGFFIERALKFKEYEELQQERLDGQID